MDVEDLEQKYRAAERSDDSRRHRRFCKLLLSSDDPEIVDYHFHLLKRRDNWDLYLEIRAAFEERGSEVEKYLIERLDAEQDPALQSDALHLLGMMDSAAARPAARRFIQHPGPELREVACYVLGWVGTPEDVEVLHDRLVNDVEPEIRSTAASAHSQLAERRPEATERVVDSLKRALTKEQDEIVAGWIIIALQDVTGLDFGLEEEIGEDDFAGDVEAAKTSALRELR